MKKYGLNELREMFLSFFETKGHLRLPSFSLIPQNDHSILLINAGMTPMKPWFKGEEEPPRHRVCTCQKCIRTGDIDNVGHTARHGTYFEMLGNFSFGDYFKKEAIAWSWEFLTSPEWVGLDPERLYPSVYLEDDEAWTIWHEDIGIPSERIFRFGKEDNFWEHGSGPCGPCSEIYYDRGAEYGCGKPDCTVGCDCDRYMEVWNNVFTQFDNDGNNHYTDLAQKNIDTGMGLERLAVVCQGVNSLFEVDTVMNITNKVSELTGAHYGQSEARNVSLRVITDHIRSAVFMICDGVLPSNEGRGYVLRRLLRRAARHGKLLGVNDPFLYQVVDTVIHENECEYKDLREKQDYITRVILTEEQSFARTIDGGIRIFTEMLSALRESGSTVFSGEDAFKLYDTYGFPIDLTMEMAQDEGLTVDEEGFRAFMQQQKERARKAREELGDLGWAGVEFGKEIPSTQFTGYDSDTLSDAKVVALVVEGEHAEELMAGVEGIVVLDRSPFYAEMGGQTADHGELTADGMRFVIHDVQKNKGGKFMHYGTVTEGIIKVGDAVTASIDSERRRAVRRAHSATHLLQSALRETLGEHVHQSGSFVEPDRLRFDFTHFSAVTAEELQRVEDRVNDLVLQGLAVAVREMPIDEARKLGAMALFGEKYGDVVRVVDMSGVSVEFCGGTHVANTALIGGVRLVSESSVASGVRRIEAVTGKLLLQQLGEQTALVNRTAELLKTVPAELTRRAESVVQELRETHQTVDRLMDRLLAAEAESLVRAAREVNGLKVVTGVRGDLQPAELRRLGDFIRDREQAAVAVLALVLESKVTFLCVCGKQAVAKGVRAGDLVRAVSAAAGGKGGGKPDSAMGGGSDPTLVDAALALADGFVAEKTAE